MKTNFTVQCYFIACTFFTANVFAQKVKLAKTATNDHTRMISSQYIDYWISNNGRGATDPNQGRDLGFYFPKGTPKSAIYADGFLYAGIVQLPDGFEELRSNGGTYTTGLQAGKILTYGKKENGTYTAPVADNPSNSRYKVYKIASGQAKGTYNAEEISMLNSDYENWPIADGAPVDESGKPLLLGDETMWDVCNDMSVTRANQLYGSKPIGIEMQTTVWANHYEDARGFVIYIKRKLINKSGLNIRDFYFSFWSDPDLGGASDDLAGVDTLNQLCYMYNADNSDWTYDQGTVPAVGYALMQGPIADGLPTDTAYYFNQIIPGKRNIKSSSFVYYIGAGPVEISDPPLGSPNGTIYLYRYMRGLNALGQPLTTTDGKPTKYMVAGDPVTQTGDLDGKKYAPGDRRMMLSFGPFNFMQGDTQEVVYAVAIGLGADNFASITELRKNISYAKFEFQNNIVKEMNQLKPSLSAYGADKKIVLDWGSPESVNKLQSFNKGNYNLEGYIVRQLDPVHPDDLTKSTVIGVYDIKNDIGNIIQYLPVVYQDGTMDVRKKLVIKANNSGIKHTLRLDKDYLTGENLINHVEYHYGISCYFLNRKFPNPVMIESEVVKVKATPIPFEFGKSKPEALTTVRADKTNSSPGSAFVKPIIINPDKITGDEYEISVSSVDAQQKPVTWKLVNKTKSLDVFESSLFEESDANLTTDGILWQLINSDSTGQDFGLSPNDKWSVNTSSLAVSLNTGQAKSDLNRINIYPNPYFGGNAYESHRFYKKVTFTNLPNNVTIRIFTISGSNVGTLRKNDDRTTMDWNLLNESNFLVASGMYIAYIETEFGVRILKFAVIQDQPFLEAI